MFLMKKFLPLIIRGAILLTLVILLIVLSILKNDPEVCEAMTRGFARVYGLVNSKITSIIPFSLTELMFVTLAIGVVTLLVFSIISLVKKRFQAALCRIIEIGAVILVVFDMYNLSCEFGYKREKMPLPYYENQIVRTEHIPIYNYFANDLNYCISQLEFEETGEVKSDLTLKELGEEVKKAYSIIEGNDYYASHFGGVKPMVSSFIYREFQITGVTFSPLAEANINILNTKTNLPLTVAHELAHTKGVMREDDANQLAFYVCLNSDNPYLRYAAYVVYFGQITAMTSRVYLYPEEIETLTPIDAQFNKTRSYEYQYWKEHDLLGDIGEFWNDLYIKMSGVQEGTASYHAGTTPQYDPESSRLIPSLYQKIFFEKYYRLQSV